MNIKSDGIFTIQKGQGISQGIANEIGLSEQVGFTKPTLFIVGIVMPTYDFYLFLQNSQK